MREKKVTKLTEESVAASNTQKRLHFQKQRRLLVEKLAEQVRPSIEASAEFQRKEQARVDKGRARPFGVSEGIVASATKIPQSAHKPSARVKAALRKTERGKRRPLGANRGINPDMHM